MTAKFASPGLQRVYDRIASGPCACPDIVRDCVIPYSSLGRYIRELQDGKHIRKIGMAPQAGRHDLRCDSPIYAIWGTPLLPPLAFVETTHRVASQTPHRLITQKPQPAPGSGVTPKGNYHHEFTELRRNPFEHMQLAMLTR